MPRTTQLFVASTFYGLLNLVAAIDSNQFGGTPPTAPVDVETAVPARRMLLISNNSTIPEIVPDLTQSPGFASLSKRFDRVLSYNDAIRPFHPSAWAPRAADQPLWERCFRSLWELGDDDLELIVESIQVPPAQTIAKIFSDAAITVYADGLMSYGPTRFELDALIGTRIEQLVYADLVPGLDPLLLSEFDVARTIIPTPAVTRVISEIADPLDLNAIERFARDEPVVVLLGQYLSALDILTPAEEERLHLEMLTGAIGRGYRRVIFKPHPTAPRELAESLRRASRRHGIEFTVLSEPVLAEALYARLEVEAVVGCFSTAMITATRYFEIPAFRVGTGLMLERLSPYENSNRIPVTIIDATVPALAGDSTATPAAAMINDLVAAVGYAMQPFVQAAGRPAAEVFLAAHYAELAPYFKRRRLTKLDLPGALPPSSRPMIMLRAGDRVRRAVWTRSRGPIRGLRRRLRTVAARRSPRRE